MHTVGIAKILENIPRRNKMNTNRSWIVWLGVGILILAIALPLVVKVGGSYYRWGFNRNQVQNPNTPECPDCICKECETSPEGKVEEVNSSEMATCLYKAGSLGLPQDVASFVCKGTEGQVSERLTSGTIVPFGTITFDCQDTVWVLEDFSVPQTANYSFSYVGAEKNLLLSPFLLGTELGYASDCKTRVPFSVCYNTTDEGCELPAGVETEVFPTK